MPDLDFNIEKFLEQPVFKRILEQGQYNYLSQLLLDKDVSEEGTQISLIRYSHLLLNYQLSQKKELESNDFHQERFDEAYHLLKSVNINSFGKEFGDLWGIEGIDNTLLYYFYVAITGLISNNNIKVRIDLKRYETNSFEDFEKWDLRILKAIFRALILLIRKDGDKNDVKNSLEIIEQLKQEQDKFEENYLVDTDKRSQVGKALNLVGLYHICKILTETASYLLQGYDYDQNLVTLIRKHSKYARETLSSTPRLQSTVYLIELACILLRNNSIWHRTSGLGANIKNLCDKLSEQNIIDLLPSQQSALGENLLDPYSSVTVVQMPTSAGKTLLAEFSILQTKALEPNSKIVYVVPTRALMNQTLSQLREDFSGLKNEISIEKSSGAIEVDPTENEFLKSEIDVLVTTPEKLDLLIRKKHPITNDLTKVIIDEAHNIRDGERGARLELLLSIVKKEKPNAQFLLLSPFLPNAEVLKDWLAEDKDAISPIKVDWKPADKIFIGLKELTNDFRIRFLHSAYDKGWLESGEPKKFEYHKDIELSSDTNKNSKTRLLEYSSQKFAKADKSILYLCWGKRTSDKRAKFIASNINTKKSSEKIDLVKKYINEEYGEDNTLSGILEKGVTTHHAGLTDDVKRLVEYLIKEREIQHICATTTVAQGINFPISTVFFDSFLKGRQNRNVHWTQKRLSINEFRNISGRAGRTLVDNVGTIIIPFNSKKNRDDYAEYYLSKDAEEISSALLDLILSYEEIIKAFGEENNSYDRAKIFEKHESLSSLVQYLIHLLNVSDDEYYSNELDDLFRDSLGFKLLEGDDKKEKFLRICRTLYNDLNNRTSKSVLKYADKTGFSVPSVLEIMNAKKDNEQISNNESWKSDTLFKADNDYLTSKIEVIGHLREVKLGTESDEAPFNPKLIANILKGWVQGENLSNLSKLHPTFSNDDDRLNNFVTYLTQTVFKSSWGLSALEGIVNSTESEDIAENSHIPSMVYYGVDKESAVPLRVMGAPRGIASNLSSIIYSDQEPKTYQDLRNSIKGFSSKDWDEVRPSNSTLNGKEWKQVTKILMS